MHPSENLERVQVFFEEGMQLSKEGKLDEAVEKYSAVLQLNPDYIPAINQLAVIYERQQEFDQAINCLQSIIQLRPSAKQVKTRLAKLLTKQENTQGSIEEQQSRDDRFIYKSIDNGSYFKMIMNDVHTFLFDSSVNKIGNWVRRQCKDNQIHEPIMSRLIYKFAVRNPDMVFFDIGAYLGFFGLLALSVSKGDMNVKSFEMNPKSFNFLKKNIQLNKHLYLENIEAVNVALSEIDQKERLTKYQDFIIDPKIDNAAEDKIDFMTLDTYCNTNNIFPDLIKLDVEGYEGKIIQGARGVLSKYKPVILLELHSNKILQEHGLTRIKVIEELIALGYDCYYGGKHRRNLSNEMDFKDLEKVDLLDNKINEGGDDLYVFTA